MPIYEYECKECNKIFSRFKQNMNDNKTPSCPKCKGLTKKIISKSSFILIGEGFYVNDYKNKGNKKE